MAAARPSGRGGPVWASFALTLLLGACAPSTPPPCPPRTGVPGDATATASTFFQRGRADVAPQARSAFCAFQHRALYFGWSRFTVHGHATPTGDAVADEALSRIRSEAVARELVRIGFPASTLIVRAHGANRPDPLLPVGDPYQNRVDVVAPAGLRQGLHDAYSYLYE